MSEQIDTLRTESGPDTSLFTVNTAVNSVTAAGAVGDGILSDAGDLPFFQQGDTIRILSIGYVLPYSFVLGQIPGAIPLFDMAEISLRYQLRAGGPFLSLPVMSSGSLYVPYGMYELALDVFADLSQVGDDYQLGAKFVDTKPEISMINAPAGLDGLVLSIPIWVKVLHNLALVV